MNKNKNKFQKFSSSNQFLHLLKISIYSEEINFERLFFEEVDERNKKSEQRNEEPEI